jgi:ADP-heptose:LPS heptosyltransferase
MGMDKIMNTNVKKIAIIHAARIGDIINTQPLCRVVKENYPNAKIVFITWPEGKEIAKLLPEVDEVETFDNRAKNPLYFIREALYINSKHQIDLAIVVNHSFIYTFFAYLIGAKYRIGRLKKGADFLLNKNFNNKQEKKDCHVSENFLEAIAPIGMYTNDYSLNLKTDFDTEDIDYVNNLIDESEYSQYKLIGLSPCSAMECKDWIPEEAKKFVDLINQTSDYKVVLTGDEVAGRFAQEIRNLGTDDFLDLSCQTNLKQFAVLINKFNKFVSVDTGSAHFAYAYNVPTVVMFFMNIFKEWGPTNLNLHKILYFEDKTLLKAEDLLSKLELQMPTFI